MKVLSLFDGISCGMVALERCGFPVERYVAYEIEDSAVRISERNYPFIEHRGDVFKADFKEFEGFDLLIGGSPCTYWSISQTHHREVTPDGFGGKLFMEYVRALRESGCKWFLYENNYSIDRGIKCFISDELGVEPVTIDSGLVCGQQRKRCYWTNIGYITKPQDKGICVLDAIRGTHDMFCPNSDPVRVGKVGQGRQGCRIYSALGKGVTMLASEVPGIYRIPTEDGGYEDVHLTPEEAERMQTLPVGYTAGESKSARYHGIGNGWTVDVICHILNHIPESQRV